MNQIENRLPIPHSIRARPSSAKQPTWQQPQSRRRPTICQCDSHQTTRTTDQILNRTPIPNPVRTTPPAARSLSLIITQEPQNTNTPPAHPTAAAIPTTTTQPRSTDQIANHWPIPDPVRTTPPANRPPTVIIIKPQNTNTQATLRRRSTDPPGIRQPTSADQIGNHILTSGPVRSRSPDDRNAASAITRSLATRACRRRGGLRR